LPPAVPRGQVDDSIAGKVKARPPRPPYEAPPEASPAAVAAPVAGPIPEAEMPPQSDGNTVAATAAPNTADRGVFRAAVLRRLEGGDVVALDPDADNPPTVTDPLTMAEAVAFALDNNFGAKAAKAKTETSRWELVGGVGQYLPRIDYEYRTGKQDSAPSSYHTVTAANTYAIVPQSRHPSWMSTVTLRQPLADVSIIADILSRSYTLDASAADEVATREKLALDTITSFFRLVQSRLSIGFANSYKSALERLAQRMRDRVSGGGASGVELDRINARSVSAHSAEIEARAEYQAASVEFRRVTGVSPIKLALPTSLLPELPSKVEDVLVKALKGNPDYIAAMARTDAAHALTAKAFGSLLPKVTMELGRQTTWNSGGISKEVPAAVAPSELYAKTSNKYIATVFTWTLNGGVDLGQGMANTAAARQASYAATDTRQRLEEGIRVGFNSLTAADSRIDALSMAVQSNTKVVASFEEQYANGGRQLLDLLDAYERLYQSQTELTRLMVAEATGYYSIRRQMGELVDAILSREKN